MKTNTSNKMGSRTGAIGDSNRTTCSAESAKALNSLFDRYLAITNKKK